MPTVVAAAGGTYSLTDLVLGIHVRTGSIPLALVLMAAAAYGFLLLLVHVLLPLPIWLHLVSDRHTPVTLAEARELAPPFVANRRGEWSEVPELEDQPREERVAHLRDLLRRRREEGVMFGPCPSPSSAHSNLPGTFETREPAGTTPRAPGW